MRGGFSQELYIEWSTMCLDMCGKLLPVTTMQVAVEDDIAYIVMAHEIADTEAPLRFSDGSIGRALSFSYGAHRILTTDIN